MRQGQHSYDSRVHKFSLLLIEQGVLKKEGKKPRDRSNYWYRATYYITHISVEK